MARGRGKNAPDRSDIVMARDPSMLDAEVLDGLQSLEVPGHLPEHAAAMWGHIVRQAVPMQLLHPEDTILLEMMCMEYQIYRDAMESYLSHPPRRRVREPVAGGGWKRNTDIDVMNSAMSQVLRISRQLGISPLARTVLNLNQAVATSMMSVAFPKKVERLFEKEEGRR